MGNLNVWLDLQGASGKVTLFHPSSSYYVQKFWMVLSPRILDKVTFGISLFVEMAPRLTHLFAKDSLLFCRSSHQECQKVLNILDVYGSCSGQEINALIQEKR